VGAALLQGCAIRAPKDHLEPELPEPDKAPYQDGKKNDQAQDDAAPSPPAMAMLGINTQGNRRSKRMRALLFGI